MATSQNDNRELTVEGGAPTPVSTWVSLDQGSHWACSGAMATSSRVGLLSKGPCPGSHQIEERLELRGARAAEIWAEPQREALGKKVLEIWGLLGVA